MKILFIGDVVGQPGRAAVAALVPKLRVEREIDFVIANGENAAHGAGLTDSTAQALLSAGVDVITTGDHVWDQKGFEKSIEMEPRVVRPLNYPAGTPGRGSVVVEAGNGVSVGVINALGRVFMPASECPFRAVQNEIVRLRKQTKVIVVDLHAEATSEKIAMGRFVDGQVSLVVGTHTHVATADEQILPKGTAYITDVGMCGPHDSVLGRDVSAVINKFLTQMPQRLEVASGDVRLCGVVVNVNEQTGVATTIERIRIPA